MIRKFDRPAFEEGRKAYHSGMALDGVVLLMMAFYERANHQDADHMAIENEAKCFTLGFAQGALDDLRRAATNRSGGVKA